MTKPTPVELRIALVLTLALAAPAWAAPRLAAAAETRQFTIPPSLAAEHEELHAELGEAIRAGGKIGKAAQHVAELLHPHFVKEEASALPPLGLLPRLAQGNVTPEMQAVLPMTDKLRAELPQMLAEHTAIVAALEQFVQVANQAGKPQYARFADKLKLHAQTEEQVLYPSAIVVGELVRLRLEK